MVTWFGIIKTRMVNPFVHLILEYGQVHLSHGGNCVVGWMGVLVIPVVLLSIVVVVIAAAGYVAYHTWKEID